MKIKKTVALTLLVLLVAASAAPSAPIPRQSPDFSIHEPSGKQVQLSGFKGKVVMIEFLFLRSSKCLDLAQTMNKLNAELGSRGFQPIAIVFSAPQSEATQPLVANLADSLKLTYPVGYTEKEDVDKFLSRGPQEMLRIPQVVIIDRSGMIRAQTGVNDLNLESETYLRSFLNDLLKEGAPSSSAKK